MEALKIALVVLVAIFAVACAQQQPRCRDLISEFSSNQEVLFRRRVPGACGHLCVNSRSRLRQFFSCCPGFVASVPNGADRNATVVVDTRRNTVQCLDPEPEVQEEPETVAPSEEPEPTSNLLSQCPSAPTRTQEYIYSSLNKLCEFKCEFGVASNGVSIGKRSRTVYRCCRGEPQIASRALRLYRCP